MTTTARRFGLVLLLCQHVSHASSTLEYVTKVISNFRFVDRDMFMQFFGGGIGHKAINKYMTAL